MENKEVTYLEFISAISEDFNINLDKEFKLKLPADKKVMKNFTSGLAGEVRIFDGVNEHPYMVAKTGNIRNDVELSKGIELRYLGKKNLTEVTKEAGITLKSHNCKICEGGGWYSQGTKYYYKNLTIEI